MSPKSVARPILWWMMSLRAIATLVLLTAPTSVEAQTVTGRVTADLDGVALRGVSVLLVSESNESVRRVSTDESGTYVLRAAASSYRVVADHLGYERLESPLFTLTDDQTVNIDFELPMDPVEVEGIRVEVEQREELRRRVNQYGVNVDNIGARYVARDAIMRRATATHLGQILVWQNLAGIRIRYNETPPSICVQAVRGRVRCALTVLDGQVIDDEFAASIPPEMLEAIVVLTPVEATLSYGTDGGGGAVLLFTRVGLARHF